MGLSIVFYFSDGKEETVNMCYSSFSTRVMRLEDMEKYGFSDWEGSYVGEALDFLVDRLVASRYLSEKYDPMPILAEFM